MFLVFTVLHIWEALQSYLNFPHPKRYLNSFLLGETKCINILKEVILSAYENYNNSNAAGQSSNTASSDKPYTLSFSSWNSRHFHSHKPLSNKVVISFNSQKASEFILQQFENLTITEQGNAHLSCSEVAAWEELAPIEKNHDQGIFLKTLIRLHTEP